MPLSQLVKCQMSAKVYSALKGKFRGKSDNIIFAIGEERYSRDEKDLNFG